jgi:hypothetical protein
MEKYYKIDVREIMLEGKDCIHVTKYRGIHANTAVKPLFPQKAGNFWFSSVHCYFLKKENFHGMSWVTPGYRLFSMSLKQL